MDPQPVMKDSEILVLFLELVKSFRSKEVEDFLIEKAKNSADNTELYNSLVDLNKLMIKYAK